ncbi:hypothetical protein AB0H83_45820 [Dactylosporangium sp. NPDC050688]|uniref:hypothetical protein n=1 Tax=Dactylosporangium sp. NPDC050688 TaxID=3157217 RepID=UPI0033EECE1C
MPAAPAAPRWPVDTTGDPAELVGSTEAARVVGHPKPNRLPHSLLEVADAIERNPDGTVARRRWRRDTLWRYATTVMTNRRTVIDDRLMLDRLGVADRLGLHLSRIDVAIAGSPSNGFPTQVEGRWYPADDVDAWDDQRRRQQLDSLTAVDYTGDPDDLLTRADAARVVGYTAARNLDNSPILEYLLAHNNDADNTTMAASGRTRLRWPRRVVWDAAQARTGSTGRTRAATRIVDRTGDPTELVGAAEAARVLGYRRPSGLPKTLLNQPDEPGPPRRWRRSTLWAAEGADEQR